MVLRYLVGLLGRNAHIIFNIVSQMGVPQRILFLLLKESGIYQMNVLEVGGSCWLLLGSYFLALSDFIYSTFFTSCFFLKLTIFSPLCIYSLTPFFWFVFSPLL